jgi:serine O-acetyltransferase
MSESKDNADGRLERNRLVERVIEELCQPPAWHEQEGGRRYANIFLPSRHTIIKCVEELRSVLFPGYFGYREFRFDTEKYHVGANLDKTLYILQDEIRHALKYVEGREFPREYASPDQAEGITDSFLERIPEIKRKLMLDAKASFDWDPAVIIPEAPIFCYPNMFAMTNYRIAHELYELGVPFIPRIITEHAHSTTGIDIHPGAKIGEEVFIDHGTGVVIGQTCELGDRVRLYQGVTLGVKSFELDEETGLPKKLVPRHPIIEHDVVIYAEATVLGRVTVGHDSIIGANVFLASSLPPYSKIYEPAARVGEVKKAARERARKIEEETSGE